MSLTKSLIDSFEVAKRRGWNKVFWAVDIHGVIVVPNWAEVSALPMEMYPGAMDVLRTLTERSDITLILYTCSWPKEVTVYEHVFAQHGVKFDYINRNPEVNNTDYGYYRDKPYFNVLLDDKAGFDPANDWDIVKNILAATSILGN